MLARDIMTRDVITVMPTMTIKQLANALIKNQVSGAPVAGKKGKIIGIVSEADIVAKKGKDVKSIMKNLCHTPIAPDREQTFGIAPSDVNHVLME